MVYQAFVGCSGVGDVLAGRLDALDGKPIEGWVADSNRAGMC